MLHTHNYVLLLSMLKWIFLVLCTPITCPTSYAQPRLKPIQVTVYYDTTAHALSKDTLNYTPTRVLSWEHFTEQPPASTRNMVANSSVGFSYNATFNTTGQGTNITITVFTFFVKSQSWVLPTKKLPHILQHECYHYVIGRYHTERLIQDLRKAVWTSTNLSETLSKLYLKNWNNYIAMQELYDIQTNHSINIAQQEKWNYKLESFIRGITN